MKYREIEILSPKDLGVSGVAVIDLDMNDPLSSIEIIWKVKVATISEMLMSHLGCLSKIEIVDGSDVLFSLSGEQAQALAYITSRHMPHNSVSVAINDYMVAVVPIFFGRKLYDPDFAFDPTHFKSPQLKITWNEAAASPYASVNELSVRGWAFDEKVITPIGFMMSKEIKAFTPVDNSYEYTEMPTDYPYRLLMIQSSTSDRDPYSVIGSLRLSEDHDKKVPIDLTGLELFEKVNQEVGPFMDRFVLNKVAADAMILYGAVSHLSCGNIQFDADIIAAGDDYTNPIYSNNKITIAATVGFKPQELCVSGYSPYSCVWVPFGDLMDSTDLYEVNSLGHLRLIYQGSADVGSNPNTRICAQQVRLY